jgi:hypothetical protein
MTGIAQCLREIAMRNYPLEERKLVYRVLHSHIREHPELMDCSLMDDLQRDLQGEAQAEGVDVTDHQAWAKWLGVDAAACDVAVGRREIIS